MILKSRKFWIMVVDIVVSIATYFLTKYAAPALAGDILFLIAALQPAVLFVIGGIALEDAAEKSTR